MLLQTGQLLSNVGTQSTAIAYPLLVLALTHSPADAGIVASIRSLRQLLWMLPAGLAPDHWSRRRLMIGADGLRLVALAALGAAVLTQHAALWAVALVALGEGGGAAAVF